jgi:[ribosomal protein S18]-alanine N-acetyltransferase
MVALEAEVFPGDAWSETSWWAELAERPRRDYVVAQDDVGVVGYGGVGFAGDTADVMTMAVAPRARGVGLGRVLLDELVRRAGRRGATSVLLEVRSDNAAAVGLYQRAGFDVVSTRRRYYQPDGVDALVMRKPLRPRGV